jgi:hypothetical protein
MGIAFFLRIGIPFPLELHAGPAGESASAINV